MNRKFQSALLILSAIFAFNCCATKGSQDSSGFSDSLITLKGAFNINHAKLNGTQQVNYSLAEQYPASNVISEIDDKLKTKGWEALEKDWLNPQIPTSHVRGWTTFIDETKNPRQKVHSWNSNWINSQGAVLIYALRYSFPENSESTMPELKVQAIYIPEEIAKESMAQVKSNEVGRE